MKISTYVNGKDGPIWIYFETPGDLHYFPLPMELFEKENDCTVLSNYETIIFREAKLKIGDIEFELLHDDCFGNIISTNNPQDVPALKELANNVINSIIKLGLSEEQEL